MQLQLNGSQITIKKSFAVPTAAVMQYTSTAKYSNMLLLPAIQQLLP